MTDNLFADLDQQNLNASTTSKAQTFPCMSCAGTGFYQGLRTRQQETKCFACAGKGFHNKPHFEKMKEKSARKEKAANTQRSNEQKRRDAFVAANPGFIELMVKHAMWNNFCAKLSYAFNQKGEIPGARAIEIVKEIDQKSRDREAAKEAERAATRVDLDYSAIHRMFDHAKASGLKVISYRSGDFKMTPAKTGGRNTGAIYVKRISNNEYLGKVINSKFEPSFGRVEPQDIAMLQVIARDPLEAAKAYGKITGKCACCGRQLTDHASIALGIGPICAEKWGFMSSDAMPEAEQVRKEGRAKQRKAIVDAIENAQPVQEPVKKNPTSVAGKYDHLYSSDMTPAQKKALRAKLRRTAQ